MFLSHFLHVNINVIADIIHNADVGFRRCIALALEALEGVALGRGAGEVPDEPVVLRHAAAHVRHRARLGRGH